MATSNSNLAAVLPSPKAPLVIQPAPIYQPGPDEILIKASFIGLNAIEAKIARLAPMPIPYPAILGSSYTGTVHTLGANVTGYDIGEKVLVSKGFGTWDQKNGAYQRYIVIAAGEKMISRIPDNADEAALAALVMNATCVAGLFSGRLGLAQPGDAAAAAAAGEQQEKQKNILIYGGSSSFGRLSIEYLGNAGYSVTTTSSPAHRDAVKSLGASTVVDHTLPEEDVVGALKARAPFDVVFDTISTPPTIAVTSRILAAQGGGTLYATQPAFGPETLPHGVERVFEPWSDPLYEEENAELLEWVLGEYLPKGIKRGWISAQAVEMVEGGLGGVDGALRILVEGGSGARLVVDAREGGWDVAIDWE